MRRAILLPRLALLAVSSGALACEAPVDALEGDTAEEDPTESGSSSGEASTEAGPEGDPVPLVAAEAWRPADSGEDPLAAHRPSQVECPAAAWGPELGGLEIQTGTCNYFYATQASLADVEPGDAVELVVFHDRLDAPEPAQGHVAILLDDTIAWEAYVEIPSDANVLEARWIVDRSWPAGTRVGLHLHNHGYNAWTMLELSVVPNAVASP